MLLILWFSIIVFVELGDFRQKVEVSILCWITLTKKSFARFRWLCLVSSEWLRFPAAMAIGSALVRAVDVVVVVWVVDDVADSFVGFKVRSSAVASSSTGCRARDEKHKARKHWRIKIEIGLEKDKCTLVIYWLPQLRTIQFLYSKWKTN